MSPLSDVLFSCGAVMRVVRCVQVKENIQGLVDLFKGSYLYIGALSPIVRQFGDPCVVSSTPRLLV
jgi:hypothetical protein